jgi:beta-glucosidase-like glycosyl hydrolase
VREAVQTNYYQSIAKTPLLITMDAEWGVGMRLDSVEMFPRQLSLGAISSDHLVYQMGAAVAAQCKRLGIQVNYAPDVDINNNPSNPVINERSFGQNKQIVIQHGIAYMKGLQDNGVMATAKHFPGHGDVSVDSHADIPVINKSMEQLTAMELAPFKALIDAGIESVMVGHLSVPAIDNRPKYATSLSSKAIHDLLKKDLGFKGIAVTDALDMQAISNYFPKGEANVQAILAGNDMLCLPGDIGASIEKIKLAIKEKRITKKDIDQRVKKILAAKYKYGLHNFQPIDTTNIIADLNKSVGALKSQMAAQSLSFVKPSVGISMGLQKKTAYIALNLAKPNLLTLALTEKYGFQIFYVNAKDSNALETVKKSVTQFDQVIVGLHNYNRKPANHFEIPSQMIQFLNEAHPSNWFHLIFGNPYAVGEFSKIQNILFAFEDNNFTQEAVLNWIEGKIQATGELPVTISEDMPYGTGSHPLKSSTSMVAPLKAKTQDALYASIN